MQGGKAKQRPANAGINGLSNRKGRNEAQESKPETEKKRQDRQREMEPEVASDQYSSEEKWERVYLE